MYYTLISLGLGIVSQISLLIYNFIL